MEEIKLEKRRAERNAQIRALFPDVHGDDSVFAGGREAALSALARIDPPQYDRSRNFLDGKVTRLSPYFRHGMITLHEAASLAVQKSGARAYKLVFEFAWRDFWRRVWAKRGDAIERDLEVPKVPVGNAPLPDDILNGTTRLACMDQFVRDLRDVGYVHNHARMWFASYVIHHRKIDWKLAADWYYGELLDGDRASNHLSWQWVGSTFSSKPYIFNRENLERYTLGSLCATCEMRSRCPFDMSYESLELKLFSNHGVGA